jgi:predicted DNA-binding transcriptional regulator AlpA
MTKSDNPAPLVIRPRERMRQLGVGKHGLAILIREHGHPKPFPLGKRSSAFDKAECDAWYEQRKAQRHQADA